MLGVQIFATLLVVGLQLGIAWIITAISGWDFMNVLVGLIMWSAAGNAVRAELIRKGRL